MGGRSDREGFSSADMDRMRQLAEARLRELASNSTKVLFACEDTDRKALDTLLTESKVLQKDRISVTDNSQAKDLEAAFAGITFLVVFTDKTKHASFIDTAIDKALDQKVRGLHVRATTASLIPPKVAAYRWRSFTWDEMQLLFK
jgi:hypothetical protein